MSLTIDDIEIKVLKAVQEPLLGIVTIIIGGDFEDHGWRVSKSKLNSSSTHVVPYLQPPSIKMESRYVKQGFINNKDLYRQVADKAYAAVIAALGSPEGSTQDYDRGTKNKEEVNPDDIPF